MDSVPLYIPIGAILGILCSIALLILHLPQLVRIIGSFIKQSFQWLWRRPIVLRHWLWWRQCCPTWEIAKVEKIRITKKGDNFEMEIPVEILIGSREKRYKTKIQHDRVVVSMSHLGRGIERSPFKLYGYPQEDIGHLDPMETKRVHYVCVEETPAKPLLGETTNCRVAVLSEAWIWTVHGSMMGKLKRKGSEVVKVPIIK